MERTLEELGKDLERTVQLLGHFNRAVVEQAREMRGTSAEGLKLAKAYEAMRDTATTVSKSFVESGVISKANIILYREQSKCIRELKEHYEKLALAQKVLELSTKTSAEKMQMLVTGMGKLAGGTVGLVTKFGALTVSQAHLTTTLLNYNRAVFDGVKIGERYGDSMDGFERALKKVRSGTALTKQQFADLNLQVKQMSVGLPMTSEAVAQFAANLSGKLGWSADKVAKSFAGLLPLQSKLPSLFDRITKAQDGFKRGAEEGAAAAKSLIDKLYAIGATRQEIEGVMDTLTAPKFEFDKWMGFEKTISKSKQTIEDVNLEIANKMRKGLELVAEIHAKIAKTINVMPSFIMLGVGAFALMGVEVGSILAKLYQVVALTKAINLEALKGSGEKGSTALGGPAEAALGGGMKRNLAIGAGVTASAFLGDYLGNKAENAGAKRGGRYGGMWAGIGTEGTAGAVGGGLLGMKYGQKFGWKGAAIGAGLGFLGGAAKGGMRGWGKGKEAEGDLKTQAEQQEEINRSTASIAKDGGIKNVSESSSHKQVLAAIKQEADLKRQMYVLSRMYAQGRVTSAEIEETIAKTAAKEGGARKKTNEVMTTALTHLGDIYSTQRKIERSAEGVTEELQRQVDVLSQVSGLGESAATAFANGMIGTDLAKTLVEAGLQSREQQIETLGKQAALAYYKAFSDNPGVQAKFTDQQKVNLERSSKVQKDIEAQVRVMDKLRDDVLQAGSGLSGDKKDAAQAPGMEKLKKAKEQLGLLEDQLKDIDKNIDVSGFDFNEAKEGMAKMSETIAKLRAEKKAMENSGLTATPAYELLNKSLDDAISKQGQLTKATNDYVNIVGTNIAMAFKNATMAESRSITMTEQLLSLGEARLALAEKMGMPQSYSALKEQVKLTHQQYQNQEDFFNKQKEVIGNFEKQLGVSIDVQGVLDGTKTAEEAIGEAKKNAGKEGATNVEQEALVVQSILKQGEAATKMVQIEGKLADLTKTWREGWMDAMEETIIGAGDVAAVIGMGDKNVTEKLAAGGAGTWRYGATNSQGMNSNTLNEVRYNNAPMFGTTFGKEGRGNFQDASPLTRFTEAGDNVYKVGDAAKAAAAGIIPNYPGQSPQSQAQADAAAAAMQGKNTSGRLNPGSAGPIKTGDYLKASDKGLAPGVDTGPWSSPAVVQPFTDATSQFGESVADFKHVASDIRNLLNIKIGPTGPVSATSSKMPQSKSGGGLVYRYAGGGGTPGGKTGSQPSKFPGGEFAYNIPAKVIAETTQNLLHKPKMTPQDLEVIKDVLSRSKNKGLLNYITKGGSQVASKADDVVSVASKIGSFSKETLSMADDAVKIIGKGTKPATQIAQKSAGKGMAGKVLGRTLGYAQLGYEGYTGVRMAVDQEYSEKVLQEAQEAVAGGGANRALWGALNPGKSVGSLSRLMGESSVSTAGNVTQEDKARMHQGKMKHLKKQAEQKKLEDLQKANAAKQKKQSNSFIRDDYAKRGGYTSEKFNTLLGEQETKLIGNGNGWRYAADKEFPQEVIQRQKSVSALEAEAARSSKAQQDVEKIKAQLASAREQHKKMGSLENELAVSALETKLKYAKQPLNPIENEKLNDRLTEARLDRTKALAAAIAGNPAKFEPERVAKQIADAAAKAKPAEASAEPAAEKSETERAQRQRMVTKRLEAIQAKLPGGDAAYAKSRASRLQRSASVAMPSGRSDASQGLGGISNRLEDRGGSSRLEDRGMSNRLEDRGIRGSSNYRSIRRSRRFADGGSIEPGSFIVKQSEASRNSDMLNSMGAGWVTGGTPGQDSVMFNVGMANGGSPSGSQALLMPGEAVVPPQFANIGEQINKGFASFARGGALPDESAMRDITSSGRGGGSSSMTTPSGGGTVTLELSSEASQLLRFQGKSDYSNGSSP